MRDRKPRFPGGDNYRWTNHIERKMRYYGLSPGRVLRVIRAPDRMEQGVAEGTLAGMQKAGTKQKPWEIWVMWREEQRRQKVDDERVSLPARKVVITAWKYPGTSPVRDSVPIPDDLLAELEAEGALSTEED